MLAANYQAINHGVHAGNFRFIERDLRGNVHRLAVDDQQPAAFLAHFRQHEVQLLAILLEDRRAKLDLDAFSEAQNRLQNLAG